MRDVLLVAAREFRQIVLTRGFWVLLLAVPAALAVSILGSAAFAPRSNMAFTVVDASGRYAPLIERRLQLDDRRQVLRALSGYAARWKVASADPGAVWSIPGAWLSDAAVQRFAAEGGLAAALRRIQPRLPAGAPPFKPPQPFYIEVPPPPGVPTGHGAEAFGAGIVPALQGDVATPDGKRQLALAVYIPADFGRPGAAARMWSNGNRYNAGLIDTVREVLTRKLQLDALQGLGVAPQAAAGLQQMAAPIRISEPPAGAGRGLVVARSIVPLALVYLLLITGMSTGSMMLQGLVEERSNKLLESVLACVRPQELMHGKLLGLGGVGLAVAAVWSGCAIAAAFSAPGVAADLLRPSLQALDHPAIVAALIFYFVAGYLIMAMLFLAIGSLSDSMQDAQSYLMPVMMVIMLPVIMMMQASLRSPDSPVVHVLSWIPLYTPFAMLARLGNGVPALEMAGTGVVLVAFVALELMLLGRVFRASLLSAGQPATPAVFARLMFQRPEG
jgi:ABC-2 type transport system permease protein